MIEEAQAERAGGAGAAVVGSSPTDANDDPPGASFEGVRNQLADAARCREPRSPILGRDEHEAARGRRLDHRRHGVMVAPQRVHGALRGAKRTGHLGHHALRAGSLEAGGDSTRTAVADR